MMAPSPLTRSAIPPSSPVTPGGTGESWSNHPLFSLDNLYRAYRQCRRRKRSTLNALAFEQDLEANLLALREELSRGTYRPGRFLAFLVTKPKRREIFAADFRDRVVHHVLVGHLEPAWERRFIHDSYACRRGKGTHQAVDRLRAFTRQVTANGARRAWYLQLDVHGFFISLDRTILYQQLAVHEPDPAVDWLLRQVLFHDPTAGCQLRNTQRADFDRLPPHKTLFKAAPGCGLPIGNLTSQFFANVYLDALDQFVKHRLKARYYLRYCDDLVLLSADREELVAWEQAIETFLAEQLHLRLNERRRLRPISDGIDWLGYIVRPDYLLVRRRVVVALYQRLAQTEQALVQAGLHLPATGRVVYPWPWSLLEALRQWLSAYLAHLNRAASRRLLASIQVRFAWLAEYVEWQGSRVSFRCPVPRHALRLAQQRAWFRVHWPDHVLLIQQGGFWEMNLPPEPGAAQVAAVARLGGWPRRFPQRRLPALQRQLWASDLPVAWIEETGRRLDVIAERALTCRWATRVRDWTIPPLGIGGLQRYSPAGSGG